MPLTQGALAHAAFLDLLHAADPDLADRLHDSGARQPFTLSPLRDLPGAHPDEDGYRLRAGHSARRRHRISEPVSSVDHRLFVLSRSATGDRRYEGYTSGDAPGLAHPDTI